MAPKKRPAAAAAVKEEPSTPPKKQKQPAKAVSPVAKSPAKPAKAEVVESPKPAKATAAKAPSPAPPPTGTGAKAKEPAKAGAAGKQQSYPAPSKEAWKDMRYQLQSLSKAGKAAHLHTRWAQQKTQSEKRTFYYEVFLLDPAVSTKEVHKESLQKQSELERRVEGWMTEWEVGKLEGADPTLPNFESLCKAAVVGLASRDHEVEAWAREGVKQYWYSKELHKETQRKKSSQTKTKETVGQLEDEPFRQVEEALKVQEQPKQLMLGSSRKAPLTDGQPAEGGKDGQQGEAKPEEGEQYKKAVQGLKKAVNAYSSASNKVTTMLASLGEASVEVQADPQYAVSKSALAELETSSSKERVHWNKALASYPASLQEKGREELKVEELQLAKSGCEKALKELNKALAPTKVWAANNLK